MTNPQNPSQNPNPFSGNGNGGAQHTQPGQYGQQPGQYGQAGQQPGQAGQYGQQPGQQPLFGQPGQYGQGMYQKPKKKGNLGLKIFTGIVLVIVLLLVLAEFGLRWYLKDELKAALKDQIQESGVSSSVDPKVSLGASPVLLGMAQGKIPQMTLDVPSTLDISYEDNDQSKPKVSGQPAMHIDMRDLKMDGDDPNNATVGEVTLRTTLPKEMLKAQAAESANDDKSGGAEDNPLGGMMKISDVRPNPDKQTLSFDISGGLATFEVKPTVQDGKMKMEMDNVSLLGFQLPESFTQQMESQLQDSVPADPQGGLEFQGINVTEEGLEVTMHGTDVRVNDLDTGTGSSTGTGTGSGGSNSNGGSGSSDNSGNADVTRPWKNDGPVGSSALAA
ncbi:LmeA family phospholipid-binding protein [Corynebacterium macclintockiae]|uniref:LmeA family phospholipid-binding protein n=1 Tax=Corynebacterium macclintockiae TaxID=2913501 RepID=UPI003EBE3529